MADRRQTGGQEALRGPTPRASTEYSMRQQTPLPAELSAVNELVRAAIEDVLTRHHESDESIIAARVGEGVRGRTRSYRGAIGTLGAALVGVLAWSWSQVQAYGDSREGAARAAVQAEQKAAEATARVEETHDLAEANSTRIDVLEAKIDRLLVIAETLENRPSNLPPAPTPRRK
ncbi:MAG: hypothetical protein IPN32_38475 [Deltaproteobacteria bacterium]|nr:hypothetical protein [Deltaproteobacteria bacterium]